MEKKAWIIIGVIFLLLVTSISTFAIKASQADDYSTEGLFGPKCKSEKEKCDAAKAKVASNPTGWNKYWKQHHCGNYKICCDRYPDGYGCEEFA